jgi:transcription initiation factor IIE alpha subunit
MKLEFSRQIVKNYLCIKFKEIRPVIAQLFHAEIVAFRNSANAPTNKK